MAKFVFDLQNILTVKEKLEEQKKMELGAAIKQLDDLKDILADIEAQKEKHIEEFYKTNGKVLRARDLMFLNSSIQFFCDRIDKTKEKIIKAEKEVELKREALKEALFEKKKYEVLKERAFERYIEEEKEEEKKIVDEIINYKYRDR